MKRVSSRGNPWHDELGRFTSPGNISKITGEPIKSGPVSMEVKHSEDYYASKTALRSGEISQEEFLQRVSVAEPQQQSATPHYDEFLKRLPQNPEIRNSKSKVELFSTVVEASGGEIGEVVVSAKSRANLTGGACSYKVKRDEDGFSKQMYQVTMKSVPRGGGGIEDIDTVCHEAYHFRSDGMLTDEFTGRIVAQRSRMTYEKDEHCNNMEEVMATCAAAAATKDMTGEYPEMTSYCMQMAHYLPKLRHNTEEFRGCSEFADFGRVAWEKRISEEKTSWRKLHDEAMSKSLPEGYYSQYVPTLRKNREKYVNSMLESYMKLRPKDDAKRMMEVHESLYDKAISELERGTPPSQANDRNLRVIMSNGICMAIKDGGVL